jgi:hypothetical protein
MRDSNASAEIGHKHVWVGTGQTTIKNKPYTLVRCLNCTAQGCLPSMWALFAVEPSSSPEKRSS